MLIIAEFQGRLKQFMFSPHKVGGYHYKWALKTKGSQINGSLLTGGRTFARAIDVNPSSYSPELR
jgi:hypothetical protein